MLGRLHLVVHFVGLEEAGCEEFGLRRSGGAGLVGVGDRLHYHDHLVLIADHLAGARGGIEFQTSDHYFAELLVL